MDNLLNFKYDEDEICVPNLKNVVEMYITSTAPQQRLILGILSENVHDYDPLIVMEFQTLLYEMKSKALKLFTLDVEKYESEADALSAYSQRFTLTKEQSDAMVLIKACSIINSIITKELSEIIKDKSDEEKESLNQNLLDFLEETNREIIDITVNKPEDVDRKNYLTNRLGVIDLYFDLIYIKEKAK